MSKERTQAKREGKRQRVPFSGYRLKLQLSDADRKAISDAGYHEHWINDQHGRIEAALGAGYEYVPPEFATSLGQGALHQGSTDLNKRVSKIVSKSSGEPVRAFLMWTQKKHYREDQKAKAAIHNQIDEALRAGHPGGATVENQYIPRSGIHIPR